jgi:hypothetical protein
VVIGFADFVVLFKGALLLFHYSMKPNKIKPKFILSIIAVMFLTMILIVSQQEKQIIVTSPKTRLISALKIPISIQNISGDKIENFPCDGFKIRTTLKTSSELFHESTSSRMWVFSEGDNGISGDADTQAAYSIALHHSTTNQLPFAVDGYTKRIYGKNVFYVTNRSKRGFSPSISTWYFVRGNRSSALYSIFEFSFVSISDFDIDAVLGSFDESHEQCVGGTSSARG